MKSKKGGLFIPIVTISAIVVLTAIFVVLVLKTIKVDKNIDTIGKKQFSLIEDVYNKGEKALLFVDQASRYALRQAAYTLGQQGGFAGESGCGTYLGYGLWNKGNQECYPDSGKANETLKVELQNEQNRYFARYPEIIIPQTNYEIELRDELEVIGKAKEPIKLGSEIKVEERAAPAPETPSGEPEPGFEPEATECGERLIEIAKQGLGHSYCMGAAQWELTYTPTPQTSCTEYIKGPAEGGGPCPAQANQCRAIDCSSFTKWVFDKYASLYSDDSFRIGVRNAQWQANNVGRVVDGQPTILETEWRIGGGDNSIKPDFSKLKQGDLVFFIDTYEGPTGASHVGIYAGEKKMIHAGAPVEIKSMVNHPKYIGARRVCS